MANVLLGVTGSVAAIYTPQLFHAFQDAGHDVKIVVTQSARYFFDENEIKTSDDHFENKTLFFDEDEWPGRESGRKYDRSDKVLHIELRRWANVFVIAPLDANTMAKLATGICDNCLTCVWRAWDCTRPMVLAPAMNTHMWESPITKRQLAQLSEDAGMGDVPQDCDLMGLVDWINERSSMLHIVPPQVKRLACDDVGMGAMAEQGAVVSCVKRALRGAQS